MKDILIVEDGKLERERLEKLFSEAGFKVEAAQSVTDAEQLLENERFRLAILDIGLNDRSGSTLFSAVKQQKLIPFVIVYTGNPSVHLRQRLLDEGAADFIVKGSPAAGGEEMLARVRSLIGSHEESSAAASSGMSLRDFSDRFLSDEAKGMFFDGDGNYIDCPACGASDWAVTFQHEPQMPPEVNGLVVCTVCGEPMDPEIQ